jgi:tetratricopeptide (TPR) repeat protein
LAWKDKNDIERALADVNEAIRLNPKAALGYFNRGQLAGMTREYDKAIADYDLAIKLEPKYSLAYNNRGVAWYSKQEYEKALADYNMSIRLDPTSYSPFQNRAATWYSKKEYGKAITNYNEAIRLNPKEAILYHDRGVVWRSKEDYENAIADFKEAIRLVPKYATALNDLAWLLATCPSDKHRNGKDAVDFANRVVEIYPKLWKSYAVLAVAHAEAGDYDKAVNEQTSCLKMMNAVQGLDKNAIKKAEERLKLFEAKKPCRDVEPE